MVWQINHFKSGGSTIIASYLSFNITINKLAHLLLSIKTEKIILTFSKPKFAWYIMRKVIENKDGKIVPILIISIFLTVISCSYFECTKIAVFNNAGNHQSMKIFEVIGEGDNEDWEKIVNFGIIPDGTKTKYKESFGAYRGKIRYVLENQLFLLKIP